MSIRTAHPTKQSAIPTAANLTAIGRQIASDTFARKVIASAVPEIVSSIWPYRTIRELRNGFIPIKQIKTVKKIRHFTNIFSATDG